MAERPYAEHAARNAAPILEVLRREFAAASDVLEIGSGTGQHAVTFAAEFPHLQWQTSDLDENHAGIRAWIGESGLDNIMPPLSLDVRDASIVPASFDAAYSANTAHIMGIDAVKRMFSIVGDALRSDGVFCLYGPFRIDGAFNTPSNEAFDTDLRQRDPMMGVRDLEMLDEFGAACGLHRRRLYAMPSNNYIAIWNRRSAQ
jgi:cyclopropane fatty-acyl-phospholipid synthase-like methyltransferase